MKVTLKDIAKQAGVSVSTVSRVLSGSPNISKSVCNKVIETASTLGYKQFNLYGPSALREIVAIVPYIHMAGGRKNYFYQTLYNGLQEECERCQVELTCLYYRESTEEIKSYLKEKVPESLVIIGLDNLDLFHFAKTLGILTLLMNTDLPTLEFNTIVPANIDSGFVATKHLLDLGHKNVVHISNLARMTIRNRATGYFYAMMHAGLSVQAKVINISSYESSIAYEEINNYIKNNGWKFSAIFAGTDSIALGAIDALQDAGLTIPDDVSIIGCDNAPLSSLSIPKLTTIDIPLKEIGIHAVSILREKRQKVDGIPQNISLGGKILIRDSTKAWCENSD